MRTCEMGIAWGAVWFALAGVSCGDDSGTSGSSGDTGGSVGSNGSNSTAGATGVGGDGSGAGANSTAGTNGSGAGAPGGGGDGSDVQLPSCTSSLASRITSVDVETSVALKQDRTEMGGASLAVLAPRPSGGAVVGWWGTGDDEHLHVTPLGTDNQRAGEDLVLEHPTNWFASIVAQDDGVAALAYKRRNWWPSPATPNDIFFARWDANGALEIDLQIGNDYSGFYRAGKLGYSDGRYVAYYPVNNDPDGDINGHEGDKLHFYDSAGSQLDGGWNWKCSHSGDQRVFIDGDKVGSVCDSDAFPKKAVIFSMNGTVIHPQPDATGGFKHVELGELLGSATGYFHIFTTGVESVDAQDNPTLRPGDEKDVLLVELNDGGEVVAEHWLTSTPSHETQPHVTHYGENLLVMYGTLNGEDVSFQASVLAPNGDVVTELEELNILIAPRDQLINYANGDVGWAAPLEQGFRVYRLSLCE